MTASPQRLVVAATKLELDALLNRLESRTPQPLPYGEAVSGSLAGVPLVLAWLGVGKVNTAAGLALAIERLRPEVVVQLGIGGAFAAAIAQPGAAGSGLGSDDYETSTAGSRMSDERSPSPPLAEPLRPGLAAVASEEVHLDLGANGSGSASGSEGFEDLRSLGFPLLPDSEIFNRVPVSLRLSQAVARGRCSLQPFGTSETVSGDAVTARLLAERWAVAVESMEGAAAAQVAWALEVPFAEIRGVSNWVGDRERSRWRLAEALSSAHAVLEGWLAEGAPY